jgi:hypothetical protein
MSLFAAAQPYPTIEAQASHDVFHPSLLMLAAHLPLGVLFKSISLLGYLHCFALIGLGLIWVKQRQLERVAYLCAYFASAEVLWRMTGTSLFWELSKYAMILIMGLYVLLWGLRGIALIPAAALLLLVPAMFLTVSEIGLAHAREFIAFNTSTYVALVACSSFFRPLIISGEELKRLLFALMLPAVSVAFTAFYNTVTSTELRFINDSNFQLSGGFGPNQVSSILGLAAFAAFAFFLLEQNSKFWRWLAGLLSLWFLFQAMMTFSRGGVYCGFAAIACLIGWIKEKRARNQLLLVGIPVVLLAWLVIFPRLNTFTEGQLARRYEDVQTSNRSTYISEEIALWQENFVFGVGVGEAKLHRKEMTGASHSEFSRLLAEHGIFGLAVMLLLLVAVVSNHFRSQSSNERSLVVACSVWTVLFTLTAALRLVAPAFILGITFARFDLLLSSNSFTEQEGPPKEEFL